MTHIPCLVVALLGISSVAAADPDVSPPWREASGTGVALGVENGIWGRNYVTGLRARIPVDAHWAIVVGPLAVHGIGSDPYRLDALGRLDVVGGSLPYFNILRVYGGGGLRVGTQVTGTPTRKVVVGVGGQVGVEVFFGPGVSAYLEVGGTGDNNGGFTAGGTVIGGIHTYL